MTDLYAEGPEIGGDWMSKPFSVRHEDMLAFARMWGSVTIHVDEGRRALR